MGHSHIGFFAPSDHIDYEYEFLKDRGPEHVYVPTYPSGSARSFFFTEISSGLTVNADGPVPIPKAPSAFPMLPSYPSRPFSVRRRHAPKKKKMHGSAETTTSGL